MTDISASAVSSLRKRTGVSMLECKKALEEAQGDEEKAINILRMKGAAQAVKKAERDQKEGSLFLAQEGNIAAVVTLHCETDFVARNADFQKFGQQFAEELLKNGADALKTHAEETMPDVIQKLGENISLGAMEVTEAPLLGCYLHTNRKIAVCIGLDSGSVETARDVAMHAAAMSPRYTSPDDVTAEDIAKEKVFWTEQLKAEGKPPEIMEKIMMGKEKKFREENALLTQEFVKEPGGKVRDHLAGARVVTYVRLAVD